MNEKPLTEKHPCEDTSLSYHDRMCAIDNDKSLSEDLREAAFLSLFEKGWVETHKPPLFIAALSLDSASDKAVAVEAALRAGADPNELDHNPPKSNRGRALAYFVNADVHYEINGNTDGMLNNLPAIEVMLRYGADPRLAVPFIGAQSAWLYAANGQSKGYWPEFYDPAWQMLDQAAKALDGECRCDDL